MPGGMERGFLLVLLYNCGRFDTMGGKRKRMRCFIKATVVVDNIRTEELHGEWGLCVYIEFDGKSVKLQQIKEGWNWRDLESTVDSWLDESKAVLGKIK